MQTSYGYTCYGHNSEQTFIVGRGTTNGQNGKSVLTEAAMYVLGSYAAKGESDWLMKRTHGGHTEEIAAIEGIRFMYFSEVDEGKLDERRVKELSGGETIRSRHLYERYDAFTNVCTMMLLLNDLPKIAQGGDSLWRRIRTIPFLHDVPYAQREVGLRDLFRTPQAGAAIMNWLIAGAINYHRQGLVASPEITAADEELRHEAAGPLAEYVERRLIIGGGPGVRLSKDVLYDDYRQWCLISGELPRAKEALGKQLKKEFKLEDMRTNVQRFWVGVCLAGTGGD